MKEPVGHGSGYGLLGSEMCLFSILGTVSVARSILRELPLQVAVDPRSSSTTASVAATLPRLLAGEGIGAGSESDEAIDLPIPEQPMPTNFDEFVLVSPARADLWSLRAGLHDGPVGAHPGAGT